MLFRGLKFSSVEGLRAPSRPPPPALLMLSAPAFQLIMFIPGTKSVIYLILFLDGFSDIHPGYNKTTWD